MEDVGFLEKAQGHEQLVAVGAHGLDVEADVLAVLFQDFTQVHRQRLENEAEVVLVEEVPVETQAVVLVFGVGTVQLFQDLQFFKARLVPAIQNNSSLFY